MLIFCIKNFTSGRCFLTTLAGYPLSFRRNLKNFSSNIAFGEIFLRSVNASPLITPFLTPPLLQDPHLWLIYEGQHLLIKIQIHFLCFELSCLHINFIMRNLCAWYSLRVTPFLSDLQAVVPLWVTTFTLITIDYGFCLCFELQCVMFVL